MLLDLLTGWAVVDKSALGAGALLPLGGERVADFQRLLAFPPCSVITLAIENKLSTLGMRRNLDLLDSRLEGADIYAVAQISTPVAGEALGDPLRRHDGHRRQSVRVNWAPVDLVRARL